MKKKIVTKTVDLTSYNIREEKAVNKRKAASMTEDEKALTQKEINRKLELDLAAMEERLGIDGVRPSERKQFKSTAVVGTTAASAFQPATLRVTETGEYESI